MDCCRSGRSRLAPRANRSHPPVAANWRDPNRPPPRATEVLQVKGRPQRRPYSLHGPCSRVVRGTAPTRQIVCLDPPGQLRCPHQRAGKVLDQELSLDPPAQKIRPQKFAERRRVLRIAAALPELTGETPIWIVHQRRGG